MLYKNSCDPIELKKISLKIYSLRAYLESFVRNYVKNIEYQYLTTQELTALFNQYHNETYIIEHFSDSEHTLENSSLPPIIQNSPKDNQILKSKKLNESLEADEEEKVETIPLKLALDEDEIAYGKTFFSDINISTIGFFSTRPYIIGQSIIIELDLPHSFSVSAEVLNCKNYNVHGRVISANRPPYRIYAAFTYGRKGERTLLRNFIQSMAPERPQKKSKT